jgi:hypothetical protein
MEEYVVLASPMKDCLEETFGPFPTVEEAIDCAKGCIDSGWKHAMIYVLQATYGDRE